MCIELIVVTTYVGAGINLVLILMFNWVYEQIAVWLTEKELRKTLIIKTEISLIYLIFIPYNTNPGRYECLTFIKSKI